jgi:hypothetical protein
VVRPVKSAGGSGGLRATGVRLFLVSEFPAVAVGIQISPETPEQRAERRAEQRGELIFVAAGSFADLEEALALRVRLRALRICGDFLRFSGTPAPVSSGFGHKTDI